jgi:diamine N-acetyltransferase
MIVNLQEIDSSLEKIISVLRVSDLQSSYVAPNPRSLAEAKSNPGAWARAICADEIPVGFVMLFMPFLPDAIERPQVRRDQIGLWRFMIDHRFQKMGFGRQALKLICAECGRHAGIVEVLSSYVPGPHGPEKFYLSQGFVKTGDFRAGGTEVEIVLSLR